VHAQLTLRTIAQVMCPIMCAMQKVPKDVEAQRLLGEVRYEAGDYAGSASAYRSAIRV